MLAIAIALGIVNVILILIICLYQYEVNTKREVLTMYEKACDRYEKELDSLHNRIARVKDILEDRYDDIQ